MGKEKKYIFVKTYFNYYLLILFFLFFNCASGKILITDAAEFDKIELVKKAIEQDERSINLRNQKGLTALSIATINGNLDLVKFLVKKKANINSLSDDNINPLLYSALYGHKEILDFLLQNGAIDSIKENGFLAVDLYKYLYENDEPVSESESVPFLYTDEVDEPPKPILEIDISRFYPEEARKLGLGNKTIVLFLKINEKGILKSAQIVSGKNPPFDEKAKEIVKKIRFKPALKDGFPVKGSLRMPINFFLD